MEMSVRVFPLEKSIENWILTSKILILDTIFFVSLEKSLELTNLLSEFRIALRLRSASVRNELQHKSIGCLQQKDILWFLSKNIIAQTGK